MSGHSKWATIKRKKAANDAKRSNQFAKLLRAIEVAAREGGGDPAANMTLASAVEKARASSVPGDNIDRAIKRGSGSDADGARYEEITYEGYAP
ncbi:MAG TPA: YebC/PmpR family DNA-binding transcriptional regulator, partial [Actinomycetota bacterium]